MMGGIVIMFLAAAVAASPVPSPSSSPARHMPTWEDEIAQGHLPYHQLTVDDFPVKDSGRKQEGFFIKPFVDPRYEYYLFFNRGWSTPTSSSGRYSLASTATRPSATRAFAR
jgi:hypothetical protein